MLPKSISVMFYVVCRPGIELIEGSLGFIYGWLRSNFPYWMIFFCNSVKCVKLFPLNDYTSTSSYTFFIVDKFF